MNTVYFSPVNRRTLVPCPWREGQRGSQSSSPREQKDLHCAFPPFAAPLQGVGVGPHPAVPCTPVPRHPSAVAAGHRSPSKPLVHRRVSQSRGLKRATSYGSCPQQGSKQVLSRTLSLLARGTAQLSRVASHRLLLPAAARRRYGTCRHLRDPPPAPRGGTRCRGPETCPVLLWRLQGWRVPCGRWSILPRLACHVAPATPGG